MRCYLTWSLNLNIWLLVLTSGFILEIIPLKARQPVEETLFFLRNSLKNYLWYFYDNWKDEQERQLIFSAFQRGVQAFIEEYDKQNPKAPLKQVNIGMGYNRLKKQVWNLKKSESNLYVPKEYGFQDAKDEQYILYKKAKKVVENKQYER